MLAEFPHKRELADAAAVQRVDADADPLNQWTDDDTALYLAPFDHARDLYPLCCDEPASITSRRCAARWRMPGFP